MATKVDELIIQIKADTRQLQRGLADVKNKVNKTFPAGGKSPITRMGGQLKGLLGPLAAVGTAMAGIAAIKGIAKTGDEFQALGITLDRIYGSREAGAKAFEDIKAFAQTTPFQLETVTEAFIQLKSNGIEPAEDMLTIFGDAASAALNPLEAFNTLIRITQRAAGGGLGLEELEQLVNQGIPVYTILAEKIQKNRTELSELGKTAEGANIIMTALQDGLKEDFGGIMAERMDLLSTKTSNMEIAFKELKETLFNSGLGRWLKGLADSMTEFITGINEGLIAARELKEEQRQRAAARSMASFYAQFPELAPEGFWGNQEGGPTLEQRAAAARRAMSDASGPSWDQHGTDAMLAEIARKAELQKGPQFVTDFDPTIPSVDPAVLIAQQEALGRLKKVLEDTVTPAEELAAQFADLALITASGQLPEDELLRIRNYLQDIEEEMALEILEDEAEAAADALALVEEAAADALALMETEFGGLQSTIDGTVTPLEALTEELAEIKAAVASGDAEVMKFLFGDRNPAEIQEVLDRIGTEIKELETDLVEVSETFEDVLAPAIAAAAHQFTTNFVDSLMEGQSALVSFKNFAKDIVSQIIATFLQMAVVNQILNAVFSNFSGYTPQPVIGSWGSGGGGNSWDNFYSGTGGLPKAGGGNVNKGQAYMVGERGPEMFVPNTGGLIRTNASSRGNGGQSIVINQSLNFSTGVVPTVRAEVQRMLPQISEVTKTSVLEATQRGGNYRRGLLGT